MKKQNRGFSLMEVILVVVIIAILSAISGPIYKGYSTKAKQAEGYALLGVILSAQQSYYENYSKNYLANWDAGGDGADKYSIMSKSYVLGIDARPNKYYSCFKIIPVSWPTEAIKYQFSAIVYGKGAENITMVYNRTTGSTAF